ncbi:TetR/AcrR family transcriptional regulator [Rhodococcus jostii]|uniref:TetR/AcrR family transcriptional regulator n=1 Tax=Rhodococcus jostii TaxID=132919 RepID=A0ABU4CP53_RHOJO|nr:TetR/AcrR family transcriptional regulator [Rhodococcus jostii]MDV6284980.1 TetR/AcrR family transcriptional regulator [Rhodococcus jostii]
MTTAKRAAEGTRRAPSTSAEPATRTSARRELVENEIFEHAARLFAERGFASTNLQEIADAVGLTRPALYYYVKSKDELLARLVASATGDATTELRKINRRSDLDPTEKLRAIARASVLRQAHHPARFQMIIRSEADLPEKLATAHEAGRRAVLGELAKVVDSGIRAGHFRPQDSRVAALSLIGMWNWLPWWYRADGRLSADAVADQMADMAVSAVAQQAQRIPETGGSKAAIALLRQDLDYLDRLIED